MNADCTKFNNLMIGSSASDDENPYIVNDDKTHHFYMNIKNEDVEKNRLINIANTEITPKLCNSVSLKEVYFYGNVLSVCKDAFRNMKKLYNVELNDALKYIGPSSFRECESLHDINSPSKLEIIDIAAFQYSGLSSINLLKSPLLHKIGSDAFSYSLLNEMYIPDNVTLVDQTAFRYCKNLRYIRFTNNIDTIKNGTCNNCTELLSVFLPIDVKYIDQYAFNYCCKLSALYNTSFIKTIGSRAFADINLRRIELPSVLSILDSAFEQGDRGSKTGYGLSSIYMPNVEYIGVFAFSRNHLNEIDCRKLLSADRNAFLENKSLMKINLPKLKYAGNNIFESCNNLSVVSVPKLTRINDHLFVHCKHLTSIELNNVSYIGAGPFADCASYEDDLSMRIYLNYDDPDADPPDLKITDAYLHYNYNFQSNHMVYVPRQMLNKIRNGLGGERWKYFYDQGQVRSL